MKNHIIIKWILLTMAITHNSCAKHNTSPTIIAYILVDQTDSLQAYPTAAAIFKKLHITEEYWGRIDMTATLITDINIAPEQKLTLEAEDRLLSNGRTRQSKVTAFKERLQNAIDTFLPHDSGKTRSVVFYRIVTALNALSEKSGHRECLIYSNLFENSAVSFYNTQTIQLLKDNPAEIIQQFEAKCPLKPLNGIVVHLIYHATASENERYMVVSQFYKKWLESKGAIVYLSAQ